MKIGDAVSYKPYNTKYGIPISGVLHSVDEKYRAYIYTNRTVPNNGIVKGDLVKVLLKDGKLINN